MATKKAPKAKEHEPKPKVVKAEKAVKPEIPLDEAPPESSYIALDGIVAHVDEPKSLSLGEIMSRAWDEVKGQGDPALAQVAPDYLGVLHAHALSALKGSPLEGGAQLALFEQAVAKLRQFYKGE